MKRTQLYLDDDLWKVLHIRARETGTTLSELVRKATRDRYLPSREARQKAFLDIVGIRKDWPESIDSTAYIRKLRSGARRKRLGLP
ncbi:MAG TPA: CopG family transcriptional regulator [Bryobacteraceae bacterium]|nr:CopG family transcriptional regulator [Bryobacteraceae bacterium]